MKFILRDKVRIGECFNFIANLSDDKTWSVKIQEYIPKRSISQNNTYRMWLPYMAKHFGYTKDEMHYELKYAMLPLRKWTNKKGVERVDVMSTKDLKVDEFSEFLSKIDVMARNENIKLPYPDDYHYARYGNK